MDVLKKLISFIPSMIHRFIWKKAGGKSDEKLIKQFRLLHTGTRAELLAMVDEYRRRQIGILCLFAIIGILLVLFLGIKGEKQVDSIEIQRNSYGGGQREESLVLDGGESFQFTVEEREYTEDELEQVFQESFSWIREEMLGENSSAGEVRSNLNFITEIPGGLGAEWFSQQPEVISNEGEVFNQEWMEEKRMYITVRLILSYKEQVQEQNLYFCVREPIYSAREKLIWKIKKLIQNQEFSSRNQDSFIIPAVVDGVELRQPEVDKSYGIYLMAAALFVFLFFYRSNRMKEEGKERYRQLEEDYPDLINKLVLYLGAGINLRNTFAQIVSEYTQDLKAGRMEKRYMYEELMVMMNEMNAGTGECQAYEKFSKRMEHHAYTRLISLLVQNLQKGNDGLLKALQNEEANAFFLRIDHAKKLAEEASTKLLFPMLVMLIIVMVIVMAPALLQFGGI